MTGVSGVLGGYLSSPGEPGQAPTNTEESTVRRKAAQGQDSSVHRRRRARLGRPPGRSASDASSTKEKVTLRIRAELINAYRDWSWDERCQLGELVERALDDYYRRRRKGASQTE